MCPLGPGNVCVGVWEQRVLVGWRSGQHGKEWTRRKKPCQVFLCSYTSISPSGRLQKGNKGSILMSSVRCETPTSQEVTWTCSQRVCGHLPFPSASVWYFVSALTPLRHVCGGGDAARCLPLKDSSWKECMVSNLWFYILLWGVSWQNLSYSNT